MGSRRLHRYKVDAATVAASTIFCVARCRAYATASRAKGQDAMADIYEGFVVLLQEYAEDLSAGIDGRVLLDVVTF